MSLTGMAAPTRQSESMPNSLAFRLDPTGPGEVPIISTARRRHNDENKRRARSADADPSLGRVGATTLRTAGCVWLDRHDRPRAGRRDVLKRVVPVPPATGAARRGRESPLDALAVGVEQLQLEI